MTSKGIVVRNGENRGGRSLRVLSGFRIDYKVAKSDSGGGLFVIENRHVDKGGPPRHLHLEQEEYFYVLEGRYVFEVGGERIDAAPGDLLIAPRRVPHTFMFMGEGQGRMLISYQPAGDMEAFFIELAGHRGPPDPAEMKRLFAAHGMEITGPPLAD